MFVLNDGNERIKNQEKYRMSTSRRKQLAENIAEEYTKEEKARQKNVADHNDPINDFTAFSSF